MSEEITEPVINEQTTPDTSVPEKILNEPINNAWYDNLDPDLKNHPSVKKFDDPAKLAKRYVELEKMVGKDKIVVPTEKSTPEEWAAFYNKTGRPEDITGYKTPELQIDERIKMNDTTLEVFKKKAHELGLNNKQFSELYGIYHELGQNNLNSILQQQAEMKPKTETALRQEWGEAYESKIDGAQKALNAFFAGRLEKETEAAFNVLANSKGFIQAMSEIASKVGEDVIQGSSGSNTMTPKDAQSEINNILMDNNHPFHNNLHPEHTAAVEKFLSLQQMANVQPK